MLAPNHEPRDGPGPGDPDKAPQGTKLQAAVAPTYTSSSYWDTRYDGHEERFDWFFNYAALQGIFREYLPVGAKCLHVGCGSSSLTDGLLNDGFKVTSVDISPVVIAQQREQHATANGSVEYIVCDCKDLGFAADKTYSACIDKGTLDAILCSTSGVSDSNTYLREVYRTLDDAGMFLLISLGAPQARLGLLRSLAWDVRVLLLPKPLLYLQSESGRTGRAIPSGSTANKDSDIQYLGPFAAEQLQEAMQQHDARDFFFAYVCRKAAA